VTAFFENRSLGANVSTLLVKDINCFRVQINLLQDIMIERSVLILLNLVHMLIAVSKTAFVLVCAPLVAIRFSSSTQLVSTDLFPCHCSGKM
jgi:hypothetical protein